MESIEIAPDSAALVDAVCVFPVKSRIFSSPAGLIFQVFPVPICMRNARGLASAAKAILAPNHPRLKVLFTRV